MTLLHGILLTGFLLAYLALAVWILKDSEDPDAQFKWLLIILCLPVLGLVLYLIGGISYRKKSVRERIHAESVRRFREELSPALARACFPEDGEERLEARFRPLAALVKACGAGNIVYGGNRFEIITSGLRKRELLLEDIRKARKFIHIEYFRFGNDKAGREVRELLLRKAAEGVEVRFLNNNMTGRDIPRKYFREMQEGGMEVVPYTHIRNGFFLWLMRLNFQQHRKVVIIDGEVAYTGGMNLNDNYFYKWRDTHLRIEGPVISRLEASFLDSWFTSGGTLRQALDAYFPLPAPQQDDKILQVVTDAPEYPWPAIRMAYEWVLQNAREYVYIQTPYFIPPESFLDALKAAALRGVDVRVMLPLHVDTPLIGPANRSVYAECLDAGVRIYERDGAFIHSKTMVCDDYLSLIGASNLDVRSFSINSEVNTLVYDRETALRCKAIFLEDVPRVKEWTAESWRASRGFWEDLGSRVMRLFYKVL